MGCWNRSSKNTAIAEWLLSTRPTTAFGLVLGSQNKDKLKTQWNLIVGYV